MIDYQRVLYVLKNTLNILNLYAHKELEARTLVNLIKVYVTSSKKILKIDFKNGYVTSKKSGALNFFNIRLSTHLLEYYRDILGLDFSYYISEDEQDYYIKSPIVNTLKRASRKERCSETLRILNEYIDSDKCSFEVKNSIKHLGLCIEAQLLDCNMDNFFVHKNKIYLLDVENIIVCIQG